MMHLLSRDATASDCLMAFSIMGALVSLFAMGPWS
jgi:hypothetical protein